MAVTAVLKKGERHVKSGVVKPLLAMPCGEAIVGAAAQQAIWALPAVAFDIQDISLGNNSGAPFS
jgi:hypothetical protein